MDLEWSWWFGGLCRMMYWGFAAFTHSRGLGSRAKTAKTDGEN